MRTLLLTATSVSLLAGCFQSETVNDGDEGGEEEDAEITLTLHPQKQYCVEYRHEGTLSGTSKNCIRKWGAESFTIENLKIGFGGITQEQYAHKIIIGETVYNIDAPKGKGTRTKNPFFETFSKADPENLSQTMLDAMQMKDTGEDKEIADTKCNIHQSPQLGSACFTDNMVMLEQEVMGVKQVATKVDLNSSGDDADYRLYEQVEITEGPDVGAILKGLGTTRNGSLQDDH